MRLANSQNMKLRLFVATISALGLLSLWLTPETCFGCQSGSRSAPRTAAPAPAPAFSAPAAQFNSPSSQFSAPSASQFSSPAEQPIAPAVQPQFNQQFSAPVNQPFAESFAAPQNLSSPASPQYQNYVAPDSSGLSVGGASSQPLPQPATDQTMMPQAQPAPGASTSGSPGIPEAAVVDPIFEINNPNSFVTVDHSPWDAFLSKFVSADTQGINRVCYRSVTSADLQQLQCYLQQLQSIDVRNLNRNEQLAYWFNLYNARTVSIVLENYPIRSIRQIKEKLTDFVGPFDDEGAVTVLGKSLSLNDIESGIIRPIWNDPRIHYALNCASYGCPNLATTAWQSHDLEARLNGAAYEYINSGRAVKKCILGPRASKIYKWYAGDFGGEAGVLNHLRQYANEDTLQTLNGQSSISGYFYDWSLNDAKVQGRRVFEPFIR